MNELMEKLVTVLSANGAEGTDEELIDDIRVMLSVMASEGYAAVRLPDRKSYACDDPMHMVGISAYNECLDDIVQLHIRRM